MAGVKIGRDGGGGKVPAGVVPGGGSRARNSVTRAVLVHACVAVAALRVCTAFLGSELARLT